MTSPDRELCTRLSSAYDAFNKAMADLEAAMPAFGVSATVSLTRDGDVQYLLGWGKLNGHWKFFVVTHRDGHEPSPPTGLRESSRKIRSRAIDAIPALIEALRVEARGQLSTLEVTTVQLQRMADELVDSRLRGE